MGFCFEHRSAFWITGVLLCTGTGAFAGSVTLPVAAAPRVKSVVRADAQGRLIRAVVVSSRAGQIASKPELVGTPVSVEVPELVEAAAKRYDVDPMLVHSVIQVESNYNPYALSPKGAQGLMQLMPATARRFGVRNSFDVKDNIEGGVRYLKYLSSLFPQDQRLIIAAYNAGEAAVWKYGNNIPPYRETEQYVSRVGKKYGQVRRVAEEKKKAVVQNSGDTSKSTEPQITYAPVRAFVDSEGRLHMRNTPEDPSAQNP